MNPVIALPPLLALSGNLFAQTSFGRISGAVTDPGGAAIAHTKITIRNTETQDVRTAETDANGFCVVTNLPIGPCTALIRWRQDLAANIIRAAGANGGAAVLIWLTEVSAGLRSECDKSERRTFLQP